MTTFVGGIPMTPQEITSSTLPAPLPPETEIPSEIPVEIPSEDQVLIDGGWTLVRGYPVVYGEQYTIGTYDYLGDLSSPVGFVWRRPVGGAPILEEI